MNQSRVIDVEARALMRSTEYQPGFARRTAQDKKGRPVIRPNDGPGNWELRQQLAQEIRDKALGDPKPMSDRNVAMAGTTRTEQFEAQVLLSLVQVKNGAEILNDIAPGLGIGIERVRDFLTDAHRRGLLDKKTLPRQGRMFNVWILTDAGRAFLEARGQ